jgi:TonB-linked SusC/RagA family outer membrane protein
MKLPTNQKGIKTVLKTLCMVMLALTVSFSLSAQVSVSGKVTDNTDFGLPGVSVVVQGTTIGVLTNIDGTYTIEVPSTSSVLSFSFIGYISQEVVVGNQRTINIVLAEDVQQLDEVVVVGYGTQAKRDITGSVSVVTAESLAESATVTFAQALQGKSSGVYVSTTGAPGSATTIRVRGVGSVNGSDPLVIIDGVSGGSISSVPANDIESFQVLKDASATAIYGAQGANGVIIITTKQGTKTGQPRVSYNGYVGKSYMANDGYDVLTGWEMMEFTAEGMINGQNYQGRAPGVDAQFGTLQNIVTDSTRRVGGTESDPLYFITSGNLVMPYSVNPAGRSKESLIAEYGSIENWVASYQRDGTHSWIRSAYYQILEDYGVTPETATPAQLEKAKKGTDWYDEIVQDGFIQDHQLSVVGGGDKGQYSMSVGVTKQEGTVLSSFYNRYSVRANSSFTPRKHITVGQNISLAVTESQGERGSQGDGSLFGQTYTVKSWVPVFNVAGDFAGTVAAEGGRSSTPYASAMRQVGNISRGMNISESIFAEIRPIDGLTIRSQAVANIGFSWSTSFSDESAYFNKEGSSVTSYSENSGYSLSWQWTNTATYTKKFDDHNITLMVGTEALKNGLGRSLGASRQDYTFPGDPNTWTINNGGTKVIGNSGSMDSKTTMFGYFVRADYSYQGKYLATVNVRRDGSSKFGTESRWGTFPSFSLGWRVSDESFMDGTSGWLDDLKLRAGYGTSGNSNIGAYNWAFQYGTGNSYLYAITGTDQSANTGYAVTSLGDPNAQWETVKSTNVGFDATLFRNRLTLMYEYYVRSTSDMLVAANWSALAGGASKPNINIGDMKNTGFDASFSWKDKIGDFNYTIGGNISQYKNEVIRLGSSDLYTSTRVANVTITTPGQPIGMYYGWKVDGIYKSAADVLGNKTADGEIILPYGLTELNQLVTMEADGVTPAYSDPNLDPQTIAWVGRYKFRDWDGDGMIGVGDRHIIGDPHPDFTGGVNLSAGYKNWDLSSYLYFSVGNDLYRIFMYYTHFAALGSNYIQDRRENSWHPVDNPNGIYPMWVGSAQEASESMNTSNSTYIEDGTYARLQTLTLGYTIPKSVQDKIGVSQLRVYGQVSNLFTLTNYSGLDPEVRGGDRSRGIDYGAYGIPRQLIFGVNVTF